MNFYKDKVWLTLSYSPFAKEGKDLETFATRELLRIPASIHFCMKASNTSGIIYEFWPKIVWLRVSHTTGPWHATESLSILSQWGGMWLHPSHILSESWVHTCKLDIRVWVHGTSMFTHLVGTNVKKPLGCLAEEYQPQTPGCCCGTKTALRCRWWRRMKCHESKRLMACADADIIITPLWLNIFRKKRQAKNVSKEWMHITGRLVVQPSLAAE